MGACNVTDLCRLCASKDGLQFHIFGEVATLQYQVSLKMWTCLSIVASREDPLPKKICCQCLYKLNMFYEFKEKCLSCDLMLRHLLRYSQNRVGGAERVENDVSMENDVEECETDIDQGDGDIEAAHMPPPSMLGNAEVEMRSKSSSVEAIVKLETVEEEEEEATQWSGCGEMKDCGISNSSYADSHGMSVDETLSGKDEAHIDSTDENTITVEAELNGEACEGENWWHIQQQCSGTTNSLSDHRRSGSECEGQISDDDCSNDVVPDSTIKEDYLESCATLSDVTDGGTVGPKEEEQFVSCLPSFKVATENSEHLQLDVPDTSPKSSTSAEMRELGAECALNSSNVHDSIEKVESTQDDVSCTKACGICGKVFEQRKNLKLHMNIHTGENLHSCEFCGRGFLRPNHLMEHRRIHLGQRPFKCEVCGKMFRRKRYMTIHRRYHTGERPYGCHLCEKSFAQKSSLAFHIKSHEVENSKSKWCSESESKSDETGSPYKCGVCDETFTEWQGLIEHQGTHSKENLFFCKVCGKAFSQKLNLAIHEQTHETRSKIVCSVCQKCFADEAGLTIHMRLHTGGKSYTCADCGKTFTHRGNLVIHKRVHINDSFMCNICQKTFSKEGFLHRHLRLHT